jgi:hypothetical protein
LLIQYVQELAFCQNFEVLPASRCKERSGDDPVDGKRNRRKIGRRYEWVQHSPSPDRAMGIAQGKEVMMKTSVF